MSDDDIPNGLEEGGQDLPDELVELIKDCVRSNVPNVSITSIRYSEPLEVLTGNFEQQYPVDVIRPKNGGTERGIVLIQLRDGPDGWSANFLNSTI